VSRCTSSGSGTGEGSLPPGQLTARVICSGVILSPWAGQSLASANCGAAKPENPEESGAQSAGSHRVGYRAEETTPHPSAIQIGGQPLPKGVRVTTPSRIGARRPGRSFGVRQLAAALSQRACSRPDSRRTAMHGRQAGLGKAGASCRTPKRLRRPRLAGVVTQTPRERANSPIRPPCPAKDVGHAQPPGARGEGEGSRAERAVKGKGERNEYDDVPTQALPQERANNVVGEVC
jgi:hypothetical protein